MIVCCGTTGTAHFSTPAQPAEERHTHAVRHQPHATPQADDGLRGEEATR